MATEDMSPDVDAETPAAGHDHDETEHAAAPAEEASFEAHDGDEPMEDEAEDELEDDAEDDAAPADEA
jgi:hypothetical protein